jgi:hypothetical protein
VNRPLMAEIIQSFVLMGMTVLTVGTAIGMGLLAIRVLG